MADLAVWQRTIVDEKGNVIPGAEVSVRSYPDGSLITLYEGPDGTQVKGNPFSTGADGFARFWAESQRAEIVAHGAGSTIRWVVDLLNADEVIGDAVASATAAAAVAVGEAEAAADRAEAARDDAQLNAHIYPTTAAGLAATTDGDYFSVPSDDSDEYLILYRNESGAAVEISRYPSLAALEALTNDVDTLIGVATSRPRKLALPNADYHLAHPVEMVVDEELRIIRTKMRDGTDTSIMRNDGGARRYPFTSFSDSDGYVRVGSGGAVLERVSRRSAFGRYTAYPYRSFQDNHHLVAVDKNNNILSPAGQSGGVATGSGPLYVDLDGVNSDLRLVWQHGKDKMLRVRYMRNGFNELFNWRSTEIADIGDPRTASWALIHSTNSDSWPPLIFSADANGDGGSSIYTGGNHGSDGGSGGSNTAYMSAIAFAVDGRTLRPGESFVGFADRVQVYWRNEIMAYNTITLGRYPLSQEIRATFSPGDVSGFVAITAHEALTIGLDNGPQMFSNGYNTVHFYDGEQQSRIPIPTDGSTFTSGLFHSFPAWATVFSHPEYGFHGAWMDREFEAGDGRYVGGSAGAFRKGSGLKFYSIIVGTGNLPMAEGDSYEWHGGYFWSPASMVDGLDSAFTFHRRGIPHLAHAHVASGSGHISLPAWAAGREVADLGVDGIKGIPTSATGYSTSFDEIKR